MKSLIRILSAVHAIALIVILASCEPGASPSLRTDPGPEEMAAMLIVAGSSDEISRCIAAEITNPSETTSGSGAGFIYDGSIDWDDSSRPASAVFSGTITFVDFTVHYEGVDYTVNGAIEATVEFAWSESVCGDWVSGVIAGNLNINGGSAAATILFGIQVDYDASLITPSGFVSINGTMYDASSFTIQTPLP